MADKEPDLMLKFGGHKGAAGMTIKQAHFEGFSLAFEQAVKNQVLPEQVGPVLWTDGQLAETYSLDLLQRLNKLLPFGREFEAPLFEAHCKVLSIKAVGQTGSHLQLSLQCVNKQVISAVWFNACESEDSELPVKIADDVHVVFSLSENVFREQRSLQCQIHYLNPIE
jgi:single-stranded-DNA-specific exonuclease